MRPAIAQFLREHLPSRNLNPAYRQVGRWAQAGEVALLVELLVALEELPPEGGGSPWGRESLADHVERTLALTPGETQVEVTLAVARLPRVASVQRPRDPLHRQRQLATYLAFAQPPALLLRLFERPDARASAPELLAALLQELLVRGQDVGAAHGARGWAAELAERGHPLGWLRSGWRPRRRSSLTTCHVSATRARAARCCRRGCPRPAGRGRRPLS